MAEESSINRRKITRRAFLIGTGALASAALAGCASGSPGPTKPVGKTAPAATSVPAAKPTAAAAPAVSSGKKSLVAALFTEPPTLNYFLRTDTVGGQVAQNIYNKLVRINYQTRTVEPELATEWKQVDPTTWRVKLREGVKWHKGYGEFTAEDVQYTYHYTLEHKTFQYSTAIFVVDRCTPVDKHTVEFKLKQPFGAFPLVTMEYGGTIMCKRAHEEMGEQKYGRNPIGTGPFMFDSWKTGAEVIMKKNPDYWKKDRPTLEEVVWRVIPDASVRLAALRKGEVDHISNPEAKDVPALRDGKEANLVYSSVPGWNWDYMTFTFPPFGGIKPDFPTQKKEVRQAMSYAVSREALVKEIYFGEALVTDSPIPPGFMAYRDVPIRYPKTGDIKKAKELMARAGVSGFTVECITSDKQWLRRETELVAAMLSEIGINLKIVGLDMGTFNDRWNKRRAFEMLLEDISIVSPDTDATVWWFHHKNGTSWMGWPREDVSQWLDQARSESDPKTREPIYHKVVDAILEDCPYIYLSHVNIVRAWKKGLNGYVSAPTEMVSMMDTVSWS